MITFLFLAILIIGIIIADERDRKKREIKPLEKKETDVLAEKPEDLEDTNSHPDEKEKAYDLLIYGYKRLDILLISVSTVGLYLLHNNKNLLKDEFLAISFMLFILTIILNLISQFTAIRSSTYLYWAENSNDKKLKKRWDEKSNCLSKATQRIVIISSFAFVIALVFLAFPIINRFF